MRCGRRGQLARPHGRLARKKRRKQVHQLSWWSLTGSYTAAEEVSQVEGGREDYVLGGESVKEACLKQRAVDAKGRSRSRCRGGLFAVRFGRVSVTRVWRGVIRYVK